MNFIITDLLNDATQLINKIDFVHKSSQYQNLYNRPGFRYDGPDYMEELEILRNRIKDITVLAAQNKL